MGDMISSLLFQPPTPTYLHPSRHFWLNTEAGGRIPAFFIERPNAQVTILFSHGNAEDLGMIYDWFNDLARVLRVNIMAYDYTGYGKSQGTPNEPSCYSDIEAAYRYLLTVRKFQPEQIVLYGRSLGSGPSCYLAAKTAQEGRSVAGVILQSPLLSAYRVAFNFRFTCFGDKFPNIDYAPYIRCPVFIVHGTQDEVVPFWHGQELFLALQQVWRSKPFWVEGAGHNNIEALLRPTGAFVDKLLEFLDLHPESRLVLSNTGISTEHILPRMTDFNDNAEIVDLWTSEFLQEFDSCRPKSAISGSKSHVAFGRTTQEKEVEPDRLTQLIRPRTVPNAFTGRTKQRFSLHMPTKLSDSRIQETNEYLTRISGQQNKVRGTQMLNFKIDFSKAREKRKRQLQYSHEIRSGKSLHMREIDSVTRIVVQSFRKLIDCERCALFLMDESTDELYFKPVGDSDHSHARLKEIRFPAFSGVAGWVASNKMMLNIKNAYHDARFNADIDKKTGFRTRTILCHPVLSSTNQLLGVIQMVNKKKGDAKELRDNAKKKKSDDTNKGYQSCFEHFSVHDEEILGKCCSEVSKSLEEVYSRRDRKNKADKADDSNRVVVVSDEEGVSPLKSRCAEKPHQITREMRDELSVEQSTETDSMSNIPEAPPRRRDRRSSVGQLAHFLKRNSIDGRAADLNIDDSATHGKGIAEATQNFQFRSPNPEKLQQREMEQRQCDPDYLLAQSKRKRMADYAQKMSG
ncbi:hypothetical protein ACHAXR_012815 [Thalassiosira sp. AJA248-18]